MDYKIDTAARLRFDQEIEALSGQIADGVFSTGSTTGMAGVQNSYADTPESLANKISSYDAVKSAYAAENGIEVEPVYKQNDYDRYGKEFLRGIIDAFGEDELGDMAVRLLEGNSLTEEQDTRIREIWAEDVKVGNSLNRARIDLLEEMARDIGVYDEDFAELTTGQARSIARKYNLSGNETHVKEIAAKLLQIRRAGRVLGSKTPISFREARFPCCNF